ncbi:MAG: hypothetical protein ACK4L4_05545 [Gemmobacter sp.]
MISDVCLGTDDIARARGFRDAVLAPLGLGRVAEHDDDTSSAWG